MLNLIKFLKEHPEDYEGILTNDPYNLFVRKDGHYVLFIYNQIKSDFDIPLIKECRGIILVEGSWEVVCFPYIKFWNYGESRADNIDWSTAKIQEKVDGSIIKLWHHDNIWHVSSMGVIDAHNCELQNDLNNNYLNFYDLFMGAVSRNNLDFDSLNQDYTYIFELISPYNRVVVPHKEIDIIHTGTRNNKTYEELDVNIGVKKPKTFKMSTLEDILKASKNLPFTKEGYVVVDANWNRVKIKGPAYVAAHHLHNNGKVNKKRALALIIKNEDHEFLSYFPEYEDIFQKIKEKYDSYLKKVKKDIDEVLNKEFSTRKDYAFYVKNLTNPSLMFQIKDGKIKPEEYESHIASTTLDKMCEILK